MNRFKRTIKRISGDDGELDEVRVALDQFAALEKLGFTDPNPKHPLTGREYAEALVAATPRQIKSIARRILRDRRRRRR